MPSIFNIIRIAFILSRYGFFYRLLALVLAKSDELKLKTSRLQLARSLNKSLQHMGPSFIKLGQFLSTRPDILGEEITEVLASLQDKLPAFSYKLALSSIKNELSKPANNFYKEISEKPIAAASIAQVHRAITIDGEVVAVKILRPGVERLFKRDLRLFFMVASLLTTIFPSLKRLNLYEIIKVLERSVQMEMDLRMEAAAADQIAINMLSETNIYIPKVRWDLTRKRILTMEWIDGIHPSNAEQLKALGIDTPKLAKNLAVAFFNQAFRDGFFHADLHPGNIMILPNGKIALMDFGITGHLERRDKIFIAEMLHSFIKRDYDKVADLHFKAGYIPKNQSKEHFALACRSIGEPIIGLQANKISIGHLLKQLLTISRDFEMELQPQLVLLQKTMVTIEGLGIMFYSEVNMWQLAEPWIMQWAKDNFGVKAKISNSYRHAIEVIQHLNDMAGVTNYNVVKIEPQIKPSYKYLWIGFLLGAAACYTAINLSF